MPQDQQQQQQQTFREKHSRIKEKCVYLPSFCIVLYLHAIYRIVVVCEAIECRECNAAMVFNDQAMRCGVSFDMS